MSDWNRVLHASSKVSTNGSPPRLNDVLNKIGQPVFSLNFDQIIVILILIFSDSLNTTGAIYMNDKRNLFCNSGWQFTAYIMNGVSSIPRRSNHSCTCSFRIDPAKGRNHSRRLICIDMSLPSGSRGSYGIERLPRARGPDSDTDLGI